MEVVLEAILTAEDNICGSELKIGVAGILGIGDSVSEPEMVVVVEADTTVVLAVVGGWTTADDGNAVVVIVIGG